MQNYELMFSIHGVWEFHPAHLSGERQWKVLIGFLSDYDNCVSTFHGNALVSTS